MDPVDLSPFIQARRDALEREAAAERLTRRGSARHVAAAWLRRLADRLDPIPHPPGVLTPSPARLRSRP